MSSHHIVREKQEPALLVLDLDDFSFELLGQLLEWSPTVIATKETAMQLINNHIKVDRIISSIISDEQSDVQHILTNHSYIEAAFDFLLEEKYPAVNVITNDWEPLKAYANLINLVVYTEAEKIFGVQSGFNKWKPQGEHIRIIDKPLDLTTRGLKQIGEDIYETTADGFYNLQFSKPELLFIAEPID